MYDDYQFVLVRTAVGVLDIITTTIYSTKKETSLEFSQDITI